MIGTVQRIVHWTDLIRTLRAEGYKIFTIFLEVFLSCSLQATSFKSNQDDFVVSFLAFSNDTIIETEKEIFPKDSLVGRKITTGKTSQAIAYLNFFDYF